MRIIPILWEIYDFTIGASPILRMATRKHDSGTQDTYHLFLLPKRPITTHIFSFSILGLEYAQGTNNRYLPQQNKCYPQRCQIVRKLQLTAPLCNDIWPQLQIWLMLLWASKFATASVASKGSSKHLCGNIYFAGDGTSLTVFGTGWHTSSVRSKQSSIATLIVHFLHIPKPSS